MLQNQYYQQPMNNYMMPQQYQNFQPQQRQDLTNFNYVRDRAEAENWPIAPGNRLIFEDQSGSYFYIKSLGFGPNDRPMFSSYKLEQPVKEEPKQENKYEQDLNATKLEVNSLKDSLNELKELVTKLSYNKFDNKKGGNNR